MKYALKVLFDGDWLYVSEGPIDSLRVLVLDLENAEALAESWKQEGYDEVIEIVEYQP